MKAELRAKFGTTITTGDLVAYNRTYMRRARAGELRQVARGIWDLTDGNNAKVGADAPAPRKPNAELIRKRFQVMGTLAEGVAKGNIRSLIVSGSAGVGKTFELERRLDRALLDDEISQFDSIKGSISAVGLYEALWNAKEKGCVLMLDDTDSVFADDETLNILKAALDTSVTRKISWAKASRFLEDKKIPNSFEYEGQIVFITNTDPDAVIAKGGRLAPHMSALLSRSVFLDLCIHDSRAIMIRIEQVLTDSTLARDLKLSKDEVKVITQWMNANIDRIRSVSIRSVIQLAGFIKTSDDWQDLADITLLKSNINSF